MLISYKYNNVFSFNQEAEFSMLAPSTRVKNRFPNNYKALTNGYDVLKNAVIVGENAGGKTNFVKSIRYFISFFIKNDPVRTRKSTVNCNNINNKCLKESKSNQSFEIILTNLEGRIYKYFLEIDFAGIIKEELCFKNSKSTSYKSVVLVERIKNDYTCKYNTESCKKDGCHMHGSMQYKLTVPQMNDSIKNMIEDSVVDNGIVIGLFVSKMALLGNRYAVDFINMVKNDICPESYAMNYDLYLSMFDEKKYLDILKTNEFLDIFKMVDYSIYKIKVDDEDPFVETMIYRKKKNGVSFSRKIASDSSGVREFLAWAIQIYRVVYENKIVIADEMDRVLNPILSDRVIAFINGKEHFGQFIFTSHNILHLNLKNYMKEQIYFISKNVENLESELYSLSDFPEVRYETTKIYEFYMKGILGGTAIE